MKFNTHKKLTVYFAGIIFILLFVTAILATFVFFFLLKNGLIPPQEQSPLIPIIFVLIISVLIGTAISIFIGSKVIKPITGFSEASNKVAKGDFDVRLEETGSIEEVKEMSRNFNSMVRELSSIDTLRNDFVVNVSHEFKTPIAAIEGYATLLQSEDLTESERREYVNMIMESSKQLASLSGNILNLSKLENQEIVLNKKEYRLDEQIRQAILLLEKDWNNKNIQVDVDLSKLNYTGDEFLLLQVWINIISNAIKYTPDWGTVTIQSFVKDGNVHVEISDSGIGMSEDTIKKIFDKFYQGDTTRRSEGNGLGLALTKRIIDLCGGTVDVKSKPGEGSIFIVSLPLND